MSLPTVSSASDPERLFVDNLRLIDRILAIQARRAGFGADDAAEFASWAKARLVENGYAALRAFGGRSALPTYLTVVLHNLLHDYRNARWGRWRPSAAATRAGPAGVRLEELLVRDGHTRREAAELLRAAGFALSDGEVARLAARLPHRLPSDEVPLGAAGEEPAARASADAFVARESADLVAGAVRAALDALPPEDALVLRMRYWSALSVADIARTLRLEQKPLYRRLEALQARLRADLEARGLDRGAVAELWSAEDGP